MCIRDSIAFCESEPVPSAGCQDAARYRVVADLTWDPSNVPNPHWSPLIGGTHTGDVSIWAEGGIATNGVKVMVDSFVCGFDRV